MVKLIIRKTILNNNRQYTSKRFLTDQIPAGNFRLKSLSHNSQFNVKIYEMVHRTGANYVHIESEMEHNVFGVGFKTPPENSRGTPHILEHCVLSGSKKYPVSDPFMQMQNRSLNSYMNAMTAEDWTFYPFRTRNKTDYFNLLGIYLDAVLFPNLKEKDFLREGFHVFLDSKTGEKKIGGVVFNEMKGAFYDPMRRMEHAMVKSLFSGTPYVHDSGGDPLSVPSLTLEDLRHFHKKHYSPQNAFFYTFGNLQLEETTKFLDENALRHFPDTAPGKIEIAAASRRLKGEEHVIEIPKDPVSIDSERNSKVSVGFLLSDVTDLELNFDLKILSCLLLKDQHTILHKELIEKGVGTSFLNFSGFNDELGQSYFSVGLDGVTEETASKFGKIAGKALRKAMEESFSSNRIESILHRVELSDSEISSEFGLNLGLNLQSLFVKGIDPKRVFDTRKNVLRLREKLKNSPEYLQQLIDRYLLKNFHKAKISAVPNDKYVKEMEEREKEIARKFESNEIREMDKVLNGSSIEEKKDADDILPTLSVEKDVNHSVEKVAVTTSELSKKNKTLFYKSIQPTNNVTYITFAFDIKTSIEPSLRPFLPIFAYVLGKTGTNNLSSDQLTTLIDSNTGGVDSNLSLPRDLNDSKNHEELLLISTHCLDRNLEKMVEVMEKILFEGLYAVSDKLIASLSEMADDNNTSLLNGSLNYAYSLAESNQSDLGKAKEMYFGLRHVRHLSKIIQQKDFKTLSVKLTEIAQSLRENGAKKIFVRGGNKAVSSLHSLLEKNVFGGEFLGRNPEQKAKFNIKAGAEIDTETEIETSVHSAEKQGDSVDENKQLICLPIRSNFVAVSIPSVAYSHPDYPALKILSRLLQWEFLHKAVREEGNAYGSGASQSEGNFRLYSYRDPHCKRTLRKISESFEWASVTSNFDGEKKVKAAVLSVFSDLERPVSPRNKGMSFFLRGLTDEMRGEFRRKILKVTANDVSRVAKRYLAPLCGWMRSEGSLPDGSSASIVVAGDKGLKETLEGWKYVEDMCE